MLILLIHENVKIPNSFTRQQVMLSLEMWRSFSDSRIRNIVSKGPKYRFPSHIDFIRWKEEIASALNNYGNRWCKRESVECNALKEWKLSISHIVDKRIKFYSHNTTFLPPKPKSSFRASKYFIESVFYMYTQTTISLRPTLIWLKQGKLIHILYIIL